MFQKDILLAKKTTFKIGGLAKYFYQVKSEKDLSKALVKIQELNLPYYVLGRGSNVLFSDKGFPGLIVQIQNKDIETKGEKIISQAGANLSSLAQKAKENNLTGLEWAALVPGTIGGAIYINASAFSYSISQLIKKVKILDVKNLKILEKTGQELEFSPKKSIFQEKKNLIILSVVLQLKKGRKDQIEQEEEKYYWHRKKSQPWDYPSAGCIFKNPKNNSASFLIDQAGLKGKTIGGARVSKKHANFIINFNQASSDDVLKLIQLIKKKVKKKFNIELEEEIEIIQSR